MKEQQGENEDKNEKKESMMYFIILECETEYPTDILFVLDGSGSIKTNNFETVKAWVNSLTEKFNISNGLNRVGVIQYSHWYKDRSVH